LAKLVDSVSVVPPSIWMMAPSAVSAKVVPVTVVPSSVSVWLASIVSWPLFR